MRSFRRVFILIVDIAFEFVVLFYRVHCIVLHFIFIPATTTCIDIVCSSIRTESIPVLEFRQFRIPLQLASYRVILQQKTDDCESKYNAQIYKPI